MGTVSDFPGEYNYGSEDQPDVYPDADAVTLFDIATTAGYEQHQQDVSNWLAEISHGHVDRTSFATFSVIAERYGLGEVCEGPAYRTEVRDALTLDPRFSGLQLQSHHIDMVILSQKLSLFQKADLLAMSAQALFDGAHPVRGDKVVFRHIKSWQDSFRKQALAAETPAQTQAYAEIEAHMTSLTTAAHDGLPTMGRSEFYKHAATIESGEQVTGVLKAFGIIIAAADHPGPKEQRRINQRQQEGNRRRLQRAEARQERDMQRLSRSIVRLNNLKEESPTQGA